ncbi:glyoxalase [Marinomonas piezotolerans]|uniref:Glyoxalase n=1 Tax=Marinomonas piezotolerans TaxID=2213058 RepID=A0A370UCU4_9GAMM|nr:VOC family protein [Marinomonas piezotolerans]RDL45561.1 glyoxalase [Marinomonas piezotolerans]
MKVKINRTHLSLFVTDPVVSAAWYADVLSMDINARNGDEWIMMSFGQKHHDIALIRAPEGATKGQIGLQHYGMEIDGDLTTLRKLYGMLLTKKVPIVKTTDHEVGLGLYFEDPDGNRLEFFLETEHDDELGKQRFKATDAPSRPFKLDPIFE